MLQALQKSGTAKLLLALFVGTVFLASKTCMLSNEPQYAIAGYVLGILAGIGISPLLWAFLFASDQDVADPDDESDDVPDTILDSGGDAPNFVSSERQARFEW